MATFRSIQDTVKLLLIDTPASVQSMIPVFINDALIDLQREHNFKVMEAGFEFTTVENTHSAVALPEDWKQVRGVPYMISYYGMTTELGYAADKSGAQWAYDERSKGAPETIVERADALSVYPTSTRLSGYPDGNYRIVVPYYAYLPPLVNDDDSNWFTRNADTFLRYNAVQMGFSMNEDEGRAQFWAAYAQDAFKRIVKADKLRVLANVQTLVAHTGARGPKLSR